MEKIGNIDKNGYFDTLPFEIDIPSPEAGSPESTGILLSTLWNQSGTISIGGNTSIAYNEYTPIDPTTSKHSVTGCTNTAAAQIIYYFIEKKGLELSLTLKNSDAYTSTKDSITIAVKADGTTSGTVSFATVNSRLGSYQLDSAECAAALLYACGVVQQAKYSSAATSTGWKADLFYRAGFQSVNKLYMGGVSTVYYWGTTDTSGKVTISDAGYEVLIENLQAGRPVGTSYPGHALVIDGYDAENDLFHINFGWGNSSSTRWYTRDEMHEQGYYEFVYDLFTERIETFTVTDSRVYGTGTMVRAFEQAGSIIGGNTVVFSSAVSGKSVQLTEYINLKDSTTIRDFNMTVTVTDARNFSWGTAFYAEAGSIADFENFGGALIVNTGMSTNVAVYCYQGTRLSFSADNTLIYGGSYSVGGNYVSGATTVLNAMRTARDNGTAPDAFVTDSVSYSFYGTEGDDTIVLDGRSLVVGDIYFRGGSDTIAVTGNSRLYGDISGDGHTNISITVDSTSSITGLLYSKSDICFVLNSTADDHELFHINTNVYNIYSHATVSVDITDAQAGSYILFAADYGASSAERLNRIALTVTGSGEADYTLCGNGTATSKYADVVYEDRKLKLNVKVAPSSLLPKVVSVYADTTALTCNSVTVYATFNSNTKNAQYSLNGSTWNTYSSSGVVMSANGTVYFRGSDGAGRTSDVVSYTVDNIDKVAPTKPTAAADTTAPTDQNVTVRAIFSGDTVHAQYSFNRSVWRDYTTGVVMSTNGTVYFRGIDEAGNISEVTSYTVSNIDKVAPVKPTAAADTTEPTNQNVTVTATFSADTATMQYSLNGEKWRSYTTCVVMSANGTVYFRGIDEVGNVSDVAKYVVSNIDKVAPVITLTGDNTSAVRRTALSASVDDGSALRYRVNGGGWCEYTEPITVDANAVYEFTATDAVGNTGSASMTFANILPKFPENLTGTASALSWSPSGAERYIVEYSIDNFEHMVSVKVSGSALSALKLPEGNYQWRVMGEGDETSVQGKNVTSPAAAAAPQFVRATADGVSDLIFARADGVWGDRYFAMHLGSEDWQGTLETVSLEGRGRIADLYFGSEDANVLYLTDAENGDALFVDDVYTALPSSVKEKQSRIARIDEIRAGAGDDVIDMTSRCFKYAGGGVIARGGAGNDTIWANKGDNMLFGDAGNDRLVGASGNDVLAGGVGDDRMHGGGGSDIFTFGANWGADTVEQLADGTVTLWFASGSEDNWNVSTLTYTDGSNSVAVSGVSAEKVTLKFGDDGSAQFAALAEQGAFADATSEKIFEDKSKGFIAAVL